MRPLAILLTVAVLTPSLVNAQRPHVRRSTPPQAPPQAPSVLLRGVVLRQDSTTPAPYASIEVLDGGTKRFSNDAGEFSFRLPPGRYHLRARQIGLAPHDTTVVLALGVASPTLVLRLSALAVRLTDVTVRKAQKCTTPGLDSAETPVLFGIVAAVRENALREALLRRAYRFEYLVEDVQRTGPEGGAITARAVVDTLGYLSDATMPYRIGGTVFTDQSDPRGAWERMRLPGTLDFADRGFIAAHCFDYGYDDAGNYELHFEPAEALTAPDVAGSVTLDTGTFVVRAASVRLTRSGDVAHGFQRLQVTMLYAEMAPRVAIPSVITATQLYRTPEPDAKPYVATEVQTIRLLRFLGAVPPGVQRERRFVAPPTAPAGASAAAASATGMP